jgi:ribose 5-phosphate isomerase A
MIWHMNQEGNKVVSSSEPGNHQSQPHVLSQQALKQQAADSAMQWVLPMLDTRAVIGVGTGSTADLFIDALAAHSQKFYAAVASSNRSAQRLIQSGIKVLDLNEVNSMPVYVDGADEINHQLEMIKGGGGALTREKIVASVAEQFVCIADESKLVSRLGAFPLPIEVIPMAKASVSRAVAHLCGGQPRLRENFVTDNGNVILDVHGLSIDDASKLEAMINNIPGVVTNGLFAIKGADVALLATQRGILELKKSAK